MHFDETVTKGTFHFCLSFHLKIFQQIFIFNFNFKIRLGLGQTHIIIIICEALRSSAYYFVNTKMKN